MPERYDAGLAAEIRRAIHQAERVRVVSHLRPDGDAVGSLLGIGLALQAAGKQVQLVLSDGLPVIFRHLPGSELIRKGTNEEYDLSIVLDSSDLARTGKALQPLQRGDVEYRPDINIDHHVTNDGFARLNLVDTQAVATAEVLANLLPEIGLEVTPTVAIPLLTGIVTDTIGFRTSNMTPAALRTAAALMETGANLPELYRLALVQRSYEATCYWAAGLSLMQREGRLIWTRLTLEDRRACNYPGRDDADLINVLASIEDADIVFLFTEQANGRVKVSWRAQPGFTVAHLAVHFGGGGHPAAAGAELEGALDDVETEVLEATRQVWKIQASELKKDGGFTRKKTKRNRLNVE